MIEQKIKELLDAIIEQSAVVEKAAQCLLETAKNPISLQAQIAAIYGDLDAEDCAWIDREWMKWRKMDVPPHGEKK